MSVPVSGTFAAQLQKNLEGTELVDRCEVVGAQGRTFMLVCHRSTGYEVAQLYSLEHFEQIGIEAATRRIREDLHRECSVVSHT